MAIFNGWHIPFLIVLYSPFQKNETLESWHIWLFSKRTWNLAPVSQIVHKITENYCTCLYLSAGQVWWLHDLWFKRYSEMHLVSCTNTHRDVTDLVNHGMVKNTKIWISWERNIIFLRNKKILNLCFRWHILINYGFVAEVTFKSKNQNIDLNFNTFESNIWY